MQRDSSSFERSSFSSLRAKAPSLKLRSRVLRTAKGNSKRRGTKQNIHAVAFRFHTTSPSTVCALIFAESVSIATQPVRASEVFVERMFVAQLLPVALYFLLPGLLKCVEEILRPASECFGLIAECERSLKL